MAVSIPHSAAGSRASVEHLTIQELARASGVSIASIKFYLRERLVAPGRPGRQRRAYYDGEHLRRLAVIRALRDVAGLSVEVIRRALQAVDAPHADSVDAIAPAIDALAVARDTPPVDAHLLRARRDVTTLFTQARIETRKDAGSRETIARSLAALRRLGFAVEMDELTPYVDSMRALAQQEIGRPQATTLLLGNKEGALEVSIVGTVLYEPILIALRRAFHEHFSTHLVRPRTRRKGRPLKTA